MNSEQEKELIQYLASIGFKGEELERAIKGSIQLNLSRFSLRHQVKFGEEMMFFDLQFVRDNQFNAYRLSRYKAKYRAEVPIEHTIINGIHTGMLEQRMKGLDWDTNFNQPDKLERSSRPFIKETTNMLDKLAEGGDLEGLKIQERLSYKYWPEFVYAKFWPEQQLKFVYEKSRYFEAGEYGICDATLANHIVSGNFDNLYEKLAQLELEKYAEIELYPLLEHYLTTNPDSFTISCFHNNQEGFAEYSVPISRYHSEYDLEEYSISLTLYPAIEHGIYKGIDTLALEKEFCKIDWSDNESVFLVPGDNELVLLPYIDELVHQIELLQGDKNGATAAHLLQLKFWQYAPYFDALVGQQAKDFLQALPKINWTLPCDIDAGIAWNLLCGRAVQENLVFPILPISDAWVKLNPDTEDKNDIHGFKVAGCYSDKELESTLDQLPIYRADTGGVLPMLQRGDLALVSLKNDVKILMEACPENKTVHIYTPLKQYIPVNISFDPDWKAADQSSKQLEKRQAQKPISKHRPRGNRL